MGTNDALPVTSLLQVDGKTLLEDTQSMAYGADVYFKIRAGLRNTI